MKKLKISSLSPAPLLLITAIAALVAVPLRTFQLANCIEPQTGFWLVKDFTVPLLYVLCGVVVAVCLFISLFSGIMPEPRFSAKRRVPYGVVSVAFAVAFLVDAIQQLSKYITLFSDYVLDSDGPFLQYIMRSGAFALTMQSLFGLIAAFYFALVGYSALSGNPMYEKSKFIALAPSIWCMSRMVYHFVTPISYKNVSQLLLQLILITLAMIFFLSFARIASGVNEEKSMWILWFSGSAGAFLGYVCALAPLALIFTGKGSLIPQNYPMQYIDLAFAIFATMTLMQNMPRTVKNRTGG